MNIKLNLLADFLVNAVSEDSAPHFRSQYDKLIAERDTSDVWRQFALWLLVDPDHGVIRFTKHGSKQHAAIQNVARLYDENCKDRELWEAAFKDAAWSAAHAAALAADAAAWDIAGNSAAWANTTAWAAWSAAEAAARSAAAAAAHVAAHNRMAEKLLELLQLAPHLDTAR